MAETCHQCGKDFAVLSRHWTDGSCQRPDLTERQKQIAVGLLMGDAWIEKKEGRTGYLAVEMNTPEFLQWLDDEFGILSNGVRISHEYDEYADTYQINMKSHEYFGDLYESWYTSDGKVFDVDDVTPLMFKMWFVCDGSNRYTSPRSANPNARIESKDQDEETIRSVLDKTPFDPTISCGRSVQFTVSETKELLDWMGEAPPGFEHKWNPSNHYNES